jgi:translation initiation factor IF-2
MLKIKKYKFLCEFDEIENIILCIKNNQTNICFVFILEGTIKRGSMLQMSKNGMNHE